MRRLTTVMGALLIVGMVVVALAAPWIVPHNPSEYHLEDKFAGPNSAHFFGQDENGRDVLSRILYGTRVSLLIGFSVVGIAGIVGTLIGLVVGYFGGWSEKMFTFISNVFLAFPGILLAIAMAAFVRQASLWNVIAILSVVGWVGFARLVRGQVLSLRNREFVQAAEAIGAPSRRIFSHHLLPNIAGPLVVNATFGMAGVILAESTLSFLGLGVPLSTPSWGAMLDTGTQYILIAPHLSIFPGVAIMFVVLGFNFLGDGLRDRLSRR